MSVIDTISKNFKLLPDIICEYELEYETAKERIKIHENRLNEANRENASWQLYYDQKKAELHMLTKYMDSCVNKTRSKLYVSYTQTHDRDLTEVGKKTYIDGESAYLDMYELSLEVKEIYEKYQGLCLAFQTRGYAINNLTKLSITNIEDISY